MKHTKRSRFGEPSERLAAMREADYPGGVVVDPVPITAGEEVTILYNGLLAQSGADQVYLHCGYGNADAWSDIRDYKMEKTERGWVKKIKVDNMSRLNICFKDSASNWDNNNGINWSFEIHHGEKV